MTDRIPNLNEDIDFWAEQEKFREQVRTRAQTLDPAVAQKLGQAYASNPNINPQIIASVVLGGGDQRVLSQISEIAAQQQMRDNYGQPYELGRRYTLPNGPIGTSLTSNIELLRENNVARLGAAVDEKGEEGGDDGLFGWLHRGLKGTVRGAMVVSESGWQATEAFIRGLTDFDGETDLELTDVFRNTSLYETFRQAIQDGEVDLGSGYFTGGTVRQNQAERQRELLGTIVTPGGEERTWNAGLGFARALSQSNVIPYNDIAWNIASGFYSAVGAITFDPLNALGVGIAQRGATSVDNLARLGSRTGRKVNNAIAAARTAEESGDFVTALKYNQEALELLGDTGYIRGNYNSAKERLTGLGDARIAVESFLRDEAGFVSAGGQRTLLIPEFVRSMTKDRSLRALDFMAREKDTAKIWRLHKGKIGASIVEEIAAADTIEDVIRVYAYALGNPGESMRNMIGFLPEMGMLNLPEKGLVVRNVLAPYTRWFNYLPDGSILDPRDGNSYISRVDSLYATMPTAATFKTTAKGRVKVALSEDKARRFQRYDVERRDEMIRRSIKAFATGDSVAIKNLNSEMAEDFRRMFVKMGWSNEEATALTRWASERDRVGQFSLADIQNPVDPAEAPIMAAQLLQSGATVIDPNKLQEVLRGSGRVRQMRRLNTKYHRLSDENIDLITQVQELEGALLLETATDEQKLRWAEELNEINRKQRNVQRQIDELAASGDITQRSFVQGAVMRGDYFMSQWWKPLTLVRAAYILRIVPEEIARVTIGGVFGLGQGAFMDYILAVMGDINRFGDSGRYQLDALGNRFARQATKSSELSFRQQDLLDELKVARTVNDEAAIQRLTAELSTLQDEIDLVDNAAVEAFEEAMISRRRGQSLTTVTRDGRGATLQDRRMMANMSGGKALATKSISAQRDNWVDGLTDYFFQAANDNHLNRIARVAAGQSLPKSDRFNVAGVVGNWDEHVAAGRIRDVREGLVYWMQSGSGRADLDELIRSYAANGRILDPEDFGDVAYVIDKQVEHLATLVGGKPSNAAFSPSSLDGDAIPGKLYNVIEGGEQDLLEAIATRRFGGTNLKVLSKTSRDLEINSAFRDRLRTYGESPNAPERVLYNNNKFNGEERFSFLRDRIVEPFFTRFYGLPSDKLSRSPAFRRFYWLQMEELVRSASDDAAAQLVRNAEAAGLPSSILNRITSAAKARVTVPGGGTDLATLDDVAKSAALSRVKDLLYDASRRGAAMDQLRLITPFGDAWKEVWQMWGKELVRQRGLPVKRLAKGVQGLRDANVMEQDPITGEWHITVPFSDRLSKMALNRFGDTSLQDFPTAPFTMPAQSLNVLGTFSPGVGPVMNVAVNSLVPDDPRWDAVRDWLFPVAEPALPETEAAKNNLWQQLVFPAPWIRRGAAVLPGSGPLGVLRNFVNDIESDASYQATRNHIVQSLASARPVSETRGAENQKKLFDDADEIARRMFFMRGVFSFIGPGAPMPRYIAETGQGNMPAALLTDEIRKLEQELLAAGEPPGLAMQMAIDVYGPEIWMYTASNSNSTIKGAQSSDAWWDWYRSGGDTLVSQYPEIGAYFGQTGEFSIDAYGSLFARGIYERKTGDALYEEAATDIAFLAYNRLRDQFPPEAQRTLEQRRLLASAREAIQQYWGVSLSGAARIEERDVQIRELERMIAAAEDGDTVARKVLSSETGERVMEYMALRAVFKEQAITMLGATTPTSFRQMRSAAPFRDALRELGTTLSQQDTTFARLYQFVLEGELFDDEDQSDMAMVPQRGSRAPSVAPGRPGRSSIIPRIRAQAGA